MTSRIPAKSCLGTSRGSSSETNGDTYLIPASAKASCSLMKPALMFSGAAMTRGHVRVRATWPLMNEGSV